MATKTFFLKDAAAAGFTGGSLADIAPASAATGTGFTTDPADTTPPKSERQAYASLSTGGLFGSVEHTEPAAGPPGLDGWRSELAQTVSFVAGNWTVLVRLAGTVGGVNGPVVGLSFRLWRSANADGSAATEITSGIQSTPVAFAGAGADFTVTFALPAVSLSNEYLFLQVAYDYDVAPIIASTIKIQVGTSAVTTADVFVPPVAWARSYGPASFGNPNPVSRFRSPVAWPVATGITYDDTLTESAAAADSLIAICVFPNAFTESGVAADSLASQQVFANTLPESVAAAESLASSGIFANLIAEAGGAADTVVTDFPLSSTQQRRHGGAPTVVYHRIGRVFSERLWENARAAVGLDVQAVVRCAVVEQARADDVYGTDWFDRLAESASAADDLVVRHVRRPAVVELLRPRVDYVEQLVVPAALRERIAPSDALADQQVVPAGLTEAGHADAELSATVFHRSDEEEIVMAVMLLLGRRVAKARRIAPLDHERDVVVAAREHIRSHAAEFLAHVGTQIAMAVRHVGKAAGDEDPNSAAAEIDYKPLKDTVQTQSRKVAKDAAHRGLEQVGDDLHRLLEQVNQRAAAWAEKRAGELVAEVSETTRARVRELVKQAEEEGWSNDELADAIAGDGIFSDARAERIARTETADADVQGNLIGWKESGVVARKEFVIAQDSACDQCEPFDGLVVGLDEEFPEGDPPIHPNCRCDVLPVLTEEEEA